MDIQDATADSSDVSFTYGSAVFESEAAASPLSCNIYWSASQVCEPAEGEAVIGSRVVMDCDVADPAFPSEWFSVEFDLEDPRALSGKTTASTPVFFSMRSHCFADCKENCIRETSFDVTLDVVEATGDAAPFPALVGSDFRRQLQITLAGEAPASLEQTDAPHCAEDAEVSGTFHIVIDASSLGVSETTCDDS